MTDLGSDLVSHHDPGLAARSVHALVARPVTWRANHGVLVIVATVVRIASVGLVAAIGVIHLHLWQQGYRDIPTIGPLFLLDGFAGLALAVALLLWPRLLIGILALGYSVSGLGALLLSINVGLFGFQEFTSVPYVIPTIVIDCIAICTLLAWIILVVATSGRSLWGRA
jgi:hypothetical protein